MTALAELRRTITQVEFSAQAPAIIEHSRCMREEIDNYLGVNEIETTAPLNKNKSASA